MADKKDLPDLITKGIGTDLSRRDFGKGLTSVATQIATGPLIDKGISTVTKAVKGSSFLDKLPMTKNLIKEYYKLQHQYEDLLFNLKKEGEEGLPIYKYKDMTYALSSFYYDMIDDYQEKNNILKQLARTDRLESTEFLEEKLRKINLRLEDSFDILENVASKKQQQTVQKLLDVKAQQNKIASIASEKQLPFNFYKDKIDQDEENFITNHVFGSETDGEPSHKVIYDVTKDNIDDVFDDNNMKAELESFYEEFLLMDTDEYFNNKRERVIEEIQNPNLYTTEFVYRSSMYDLINSPHVTQEQKEEAIDILTFQRISEERNKLTNDLFSHSLPDVIEGPTDPNIIQEGFKLFQDEFKNAATKAGLKLGQKVTETLYDKYKGTKPKTSTAPQIQSDETRAEKAKEVKEVKQQPKQDIKQQPKAKEKPIRNLGQDLLGIGKRLKYSPLGAAFYTKEVGDAELPLETSPRGYGMRREIKGRVSQDPYKSYNLQRAI
tara:strand:- start:859 stop:2337 length:1479 start_codon:yes stop_codon:yes gene_type:complete